MAKKNIVLISMDPDAIDLLAESSHFKVVGVIDKKRPADLRGLTYLGKDEDGLKFLKKNRSSRAALALDPPALRKKLTASFGLEKLETVVSQECFVSSSAYIGRGSILQKGVKVMNKVRLGWACKLNVDAVVHHDGVVGDFCTLAPGSRLLGNVTLADEVYIGSGAIVLPRVRIGRGAVVGAGAVVIKDVPAYTTVVGVPAKELK